MTLATSRRTFVGLLAASHFPPTLAVTAITSLLAYEVGRGWGTVFVALAVLSGQPSVGWSNDWFDAARDRRAERVEKPIVSEIVQRQTVARCAILALVLCVPLSLCSGWRAALVHFIAIGSAWAYNRIGKTQWWSPLPYAISFGLLPVFVTLGLHGHPWPRSQAVIAAALLGLGAHFINTIPDYEADLRNQVRGFPQRVGKDASLFLGVVMLAGATLSIVFMIPTVGVLVVTLASLSFLADCLVVFETRRGEPRRAWYLVLVSAFISVSLFASAGSALVR